MCEYTILQDNKGLEELRINLNDTSIILFELGCRKDWLNLLWYNNSLYIRDRFFSYRFSIEYNEIIIEISCAGDIISIYKYDDCHQFMNIIRNIIDYCDIHNLW